MSPFEYLTEQIQKSYAIIIDDTVGFAQIEDDSIKFEIGGETFEIRPEIIEFLAIGETIDVTLKGDKDNVYEITLLNRVKPETPYHDKTN